MLTRRQERWRDVTPRARRAFIHRQEYVHGVITDDVCLASTSLPTVENEMITRAEMMRDY